jgi:hypothetical protein
MFALAAAVFGLLFVDVLVVKLLSGDWLAYFVIALYGFGCAGCASEARRRLLPRSSRVGQ